MNRRSTVAGLLAVQLALGSLAAQSVHPAPPSIGPLRQEEDYGYLERDAARQGFWWEPLKYLRLAPTPDAPFLSLGGEARVRYEWIDHSDFGAGPQDSGGYLLTRYLPYISLTAPNLPGGIRLRVFGQAEVAASDYDARGPGPIDEENFDFVQAFAEISLPLAGGELRLQGGRQITAFGTERLIGSRYGPNIPLSFDGGIVRWNNPLWDVRGFYLRPVEIDPDPLNNESSDDEQLWGLYATRKWKSDSPAPSATGVDVYYIGFLDAAATYNAGTGREVRHTVGSRLFGQRALGRGTLDWNYEGILQFGSFDRPDRNGDILAWSIGTETGYTFPLPFTPRFSLRANIISGDRNTDDNSLGTFNPLFPKGKYFGELTPVGPYNLVNVLGGVGLAITDTVSLSVQGGPYWRYSTDDAVYGVAGNTVRPSPESDGSRFIGAQLEFLAEWKPTRELGFLVTYSLFAPGGFIEETGPSETIHFFALEAVFQF
jgi:hypothetical protein